MNSPFEQIHAAIEASFRQEKKTKKAPLDVRPVPTALIPELYERYDNIESVDQRFADFVEDFTGGDIPLEYSRHLLTDRMWMWLNGKVGDTSKRTCTLNCTDPLCPVIEVFDRFVDPTQRDDIAECHYVGDDYNDRAIQLWVNMQYSYPGTMQARYALWSHLAQSVPQASIGSWLTTIHFGKLYVAKSVEQHEEEQREQQHFLDELDKL